MGTLINGADAGVAIITSAVAAANATLIRAHQVVGQIDTMANEWAQSPVGSIIGQPPRESPLKQLTLLSYLLVADHGSGCGMPTLTFLLAVCMHAPSMPC